VFEFVDGFCGGVGWVVGDEWGHGVAFDEADEGFVDAAFGFVEFQ
jgi:hypothetical protein